MRYKGALKSMLCMLSLTASCSPCLAKSIPASEGKQNDPELRATTLESSFSTLGLTTLVLYRNQSDLMMPKLFLDGLGTQYAAFNTTPALDSPLYYSIVLTSDSIESINMTAVRNYAAEHKVRIISLNTQSQDTLAPFGLNIKEGGLQNASIGFSRWVIDRESELTDVLNEDGLWPIGHSALAARTFDGPTISSQKGKKEQKALFQRDTRVLFKYFVPDGKMNVKALGGAAAFIGRHPDGNEEMHFAFNAAASEICTDCPHPIQNSLAQVQTGEFTMLNLALSNVWFSWVTRGLFLGQRRSAFHLQVDDWFAQTSLWVNENETVRVTAVDVEKTVEWQRNVVKEHGLAKGSEVRFELAFNGAGHTAFTEFDEAAKKKGISMSQCSDRNMDEFYWVSHTWTHQQLDWLWKDECNGTFTCRTPISRIDPEIYLNMMFAEGREIPLDDQYLADHFDNLYMVTTPRRRPFPQRRYSPDCLVNPEISGLYPRSFKYDNATWPSWRMLPVTPNKDLFKVFKDRGIKNVVGDNSRGELVATDSPHHPIITTVEEYDLAGVAILPRHALNVAYHTHTNRDYMKWYNENNICLGDSGPACTINKTYTFEEAMDRQALNALFFLLQYRQDSYMFHQGNLFFFPCKNQKKQISLLTYFADRTLDRLTNYITKLPVRSDRMTDKAQIFRERLSRDQCNITGSVRVESGQWVGLTLLGAKDCTALLTSLTTSDFEPQGYRPFENGVDDVYRIPLKGGAKIDFDL